MSIVALSGKFHIPNTSSLFYSAIKTDLLIDATAEKAAMIFSIEKAGTIDKIGIWLGACSLNAASSIRFSLQTVGADGLPTGTFFGANSYGDVAGSGITQNAWNTVDITNCTIASGDIGKLIALVVEYATFTASDSLVVRSLDSGGRFGCPYAAAYIGTPAWATYTRMPCCVLEYAGAVYYEHEAVAPINGVNALTFKSDSTPDEIGNLITLPYGARVVGAWVWQSQPANTYSICLYSGDTELASITVDPDEHVIYSLQPLYRMFSSAITLAAGSYRIVLKPLNTTSNNCRPYEYEVASAALMAAMPFGTNVIKTERTDAGAWTDTNTKRVSIGLLIDGIDIPTASGGGSGIIRSNLNRTGVIQ